ncbi:ribonuclease H-like protein [Rhypophila sp. PSN 637]
MPPLLLSGQERVPLHKNVPHQVLYSRELEMSIIYEMKRITSCVSELMPDPIGITIYIDGACRGNGTPSARASFGVYFGPSSRYNHYGTLWGDEQSSIRAELEALERALWIVIQELEAKETRTKAAGFLGRYPDLIETTCIVEMCGDLEADGVSIHLEQIPRFHNQGADALANRALDKEESRRR